MLGMGAAGQVTRLVGPARGGFLTFAHAGAASAPVIRMSETEAFNRLRDVSMNMIPLRPVCRFDGGVRCNRCQLGVLLMTIW